MDAKSLTLKAGDTDILGNKVATVFAIDPDKKYAIWETTDGQTLVDTDSDALSKSPEFNTLVIQFANLVGRRKEFKGKYSSQIAYAYKLCFDGDPTGAVTALKATNAEIIRVLKEERRLRTAYLAGAIVIAVLFEIVWLVLKHKETEFPFLSKYDLYLYGLAVAVLGGVLSVTTGLKNERFDLDDGIWLSLLYGALRIVTAVISGFVAALMIRTGIALSFLLEHDAFGGFLLACFIGGFSERFVSKSLREIEEVA